MAVNRVKRNGSYAPLSAHYYKDDAIDEAGEAAELLYVRGLAFCAEVLSDGFISDRQLVRFVGVGMFDADERAKRLVGVGLWERVDEGYVVRSWLGWNRSREEITDHQGRDAARKRRSEGSDKSPPDPPSGGSTPSERTPSGVHPESSGDAERSHGGVTAESIPRARSLDRSTTETEQNKDSLTDAAASAERPPPKPDPEDVGFAEFWSRYPRKVDKRAALKAYRAAVKRKADPEHLLAAVTAYAQRCQGTEPRFVKHAATWLNAASYDDEKETPRQAALRRYGDPDKNPWAGIRFTS